MVQPNIMCNQHLLGEHCELHMFVATLNKHKTVRGYVKNNCLEYKSIHKRHDDLVIEMRTRGMNHKSELPQLDGWYFDHDRDVYFSGVNKEQSLKDLITRCDKCRIQGQFLLGDKIWQNINVK